MEIDERIKGDKPMLRFIGSVAGRDILDIGCSDCFLAGWLDIDKKRYKGLDSDSRSVSEARRKGYDAKRYDLESGKIPFRSESFDVVIAKDILEHLDSFITIVKDINRVLKKGGKAFVSVPSEWSQLLWDDYTHKRGFSQKAIKKVFTDNGFEVRRFERYHDLITFRTSRLKYTGRLLLKKLTGLDFITQGYMVEFVKIVR